MSMISGSYHFSPNIASPSQYLATNKVRHRIKAIKKNGVIPTKVELSKIQPSPLFTTLGFLVKFFVCFILQLENNHIPNHFSRKVIN
jgi:hypothetical protein